MYILIILYKSIISAVKGGNNPEMAQHNPIIHNCDNRFSMKILLS